MAMESREFSHIDMESSSQGSTEILFGRKRCCFCIPRFTYSRSSSTVGLNWWNKVRTAENDEGLWSRGITALKKLREWSEIMAGPRWKTFIRRFNRTKSGGKSAKFQYDPLSYELNFDKGPGQNGNPEEDDDYMYRNFSSRYATFPVGQSSIEMGKDLKRMIREPEGADEDQGINSQLSM
ncbi:hypothetical protein LguiB_007802 [Lonicera macranthoides]